MYEIYSGLWMRSIAFVDEIYSRLWMRSSAVCGRDLQPFEDEIYSRLWIRSSQVVRASNSQCQSGNSLGFKPSILRHSGIRGAKDEAVLNKVHKNKLKNPPLNISANEIAGNFTMLLYCIVPCIIFYICTSLVSIFSEPEFVNV